MDNMNLPVCVPLIVLFLYAYPSRRAMLEINDVRRMPHGFEITPFSPRILEHNDHVKRILGEGKFEAPVHFIKSFDLYVVALFFLQP